MINNNVPYFLSPVQNRFVAPSVPKNAFLFAQAPAEAPTDSFQASEAAQLAGLRSGPQNLMLFGGDRKQAIETLVASGAKPENPKVGFFKNILRKFAGGKTKTSSKQISAEQKISSTVKVKNFNVKNLRLTTQANKEGNKETLRHVDMNPTTPKGKTAQVKDIGTVIGTGTARRMFEQEIERPGQGEPGRVKNSYYDPKTGAKFLQTSEVAPNLETDKLGQVRSKKSKNTYRQIDVLGADGKADQRYVFDYGAKSIRLETLNDEGQVSGTRKLSKKTDYWKVLDGLSLNPPSSQVAAAGAAPQGGGGRQEMATAAA